MTIPSICIFEALEICKKYAFYLGKMHIFCIFPRPQKCILMELSLWIAGKCEEYTENMQKICILPRKNTYFHPIANSEKCILQNAYFLSMFYRLCSKCIFLLGPPHVTGGGFNHGVKGLGALGLLELWQMTIEEGWCTCIKNSVYNNKFRPCNVVTTD